jgi:hypothetical protein
MKIIGIIMYKSPEQLKAMTNKELLHYRKYLRTKFNDLKSEARLVIEEYHLTKVLLANRIKDLEHDCKKAEEIRLKCDMSMFDYLFNIQ